MAAVQVFLGHAQAHLKVDVLPDFVSGLLDILQGVPVFYVLSGFLIWESIQRTSDFKTFCTKRVFRLYPELWGGVLCNFVVIILLFGSQIQWLQYVVFQITQASFLQFWTPDFLRDYGCGVPNGSLPTIFILLQAYLTMWILYRFMHKKGVTRWIIMNIVALALSFTPEVVNRVAPDIIGKLYRQTVIPFLWIFMLGMTINEFFDQLIFWLKKYWYVFAALAAVVVFTNFDAGSIYGILKCTLMAPAVIGFAYRFPNINIKFDYSYGIYIYHMIVINVLIHCGFSGNYLAVIISAIITVGLAVLSYHTIGLFSRRKRKDLVA